MARGLLFGLDRRSGRRGQEVEALAGRRRVSAPRVRLKPRPPVRDLGAAAETMIKACFFQHDRLGDESRTSQT